MSDCQNCGSHLATGRTYCLACGASVVKQPARVVGVNDDVQTIEFARVPAELRAPTVWTVAQGVFLGLLLWSLFSAAVVFVGFVLLVSLSNT